MTVENWLRGQFHGLGSQIERNTLEVAALSPVSARPHAFRAVALSEEVEDFIGDTEFMNGLNYALSTLYYSLSVAVTGGTRSEKRKDRSVTIGGYPLTTADREALRAQGDRLRRQLGAEVEETTAYSVRMFDASELCLTEPMRRWRL